MKIEDELLERILSVPLPAVVAVSGFGGAGKSSLSAQLGQLLGAPVISADSFIKDHRLITYDFWDWIDFDRLEREVLLPLSSGCTFIEYGHFDWAANAIQSRVKVHDCLRTIVEGVGLFRPPLLKYFAFSVWVGCPLAEATRRGKRRDREVYGNPQDENWDGVWRRNDEEFHRRYRPDTSADYVFDNSIAQA